MVGFNHVIVFNQNGKVIDYQKSYNKENAKKVKVILPLNFNNKKNYKAELSVAINNTYPKEIRTAEGYKSESDLNVYDFDLTQLFFLQTNKKLGLFKLKLYSENNRIKFESEVFRIN